MRARVDESLRARRATTPVSRSAGWRSASRRLGLYGVLAYLAAAHPRIGIRMALGGSIGHRQPGAA
jgi:hypothetical protein